MSDRDDKGSGVHETLLPSLTLSVLGGLSSPEDGSAHVPPSMPPPTGSGLPGSIPVTPYGAELRGDAPLLDPDEPIARPRGARRGDIIGGRYVVEGQIGRGGMGRVMRVRHKVLGKAFALKLIKVPIATNPRVREMFYREARLASALSHDNICSIVDFGQDPIFGLFMVMELLEGSTLHYKLRQDGRFAPKVACDIMWQIAEALRYIHGRAIIHGDIKTENILLTRTPDRRRVVKLLDFGLARAEVTRHRSRGKSIEGTPEYLAPERIRGAPATAASDIYALGLVFYELLVGRLPFAGDLEEVFTGHLEQEVAPPSQQLDEALDERADELIARATAKDPQDRHPDVAGFLYELRTLMNMLGMDVGRRRAGSDRAGRGRRTADHRTKAASEVFEMAPLPLASVDSEGKVRVANQAFLEFIGVAGNAAGIQLGDSGLTEVYPALLADLRQVASTRTTTKKIIYLSGGGDHVIEVAVILSAAPTDAVVTAGEVHLCLHPLGRLDRGSDPRRG